MFRNAIPASRRRPASSANAVLFPMQGSPSNTKTGDSPKESKVRNAGIPKMIKLAFGIRQKTTIQIKRFSSG